ncbi:MAG: protein of unknown function DUF2493 [Edafosvirus sp.]|uniref:YspA cpYpsA-related SLOG domain-containing protein n=1 Tax=Edafosvirus sp. TaxID=2487765 RepID=A0A3G4ZY20_9VIRU|nr:MAG: protein of unknown function DUF2493 [Edafosvirus sp.]
MVNEKHVGIVGYRDYHNYNEFCKIIKEWILKNGNIDMIISGGCKGTDTLAEKYAKENNIPIKLFLPDWDKYGDSAGPIRNKEIVNSSTHLIALPSKKSKGTYTTIQMAKKKKIPIMEKCID